MSHAHSSAVGRRGFLFRLSQAAAGVAALAANPARLAASAPAASAAGEPDAWIGRLTGENKVMLHVPQSFAQGIADAYGMLASARENYAVPEAQQSVALVTHGPAIQGLFRDELWERRALGQHYKVNDGRTGAPATRNVYLTAREGLPADLTVPDLMRRGVTFVVCNVAVKHLAQRLAREGENAGKVHDELVAGVLDGVYVVPDAFTAMQRGQKRGVAYLFTHRP